MKSFILMSLFGFNMLNAQSPIAPPVPTAPPPSVTQEDVRNQTVFASLKWYIGKSLLPNILVGYRDTTTEIDNNVKGGSAGISYNFKDNTFDQFKIIAIKGNTDIIGEIGIGYSLYQDQFFGNLGVEGFYMNSGLDYYLDNNLKYYIGITTVDD